MNGKVKFSREAFYVGVCRYSIPLIIEFAENYVRGLVADSMEFDELRFAPWYHARVLSYDGVS